MTCKSKCAYFQVFLNNSEHLRQYQSSLTRRGPLVQIQHRPLKKSCALQVKCGVLKEGRELSQPSIHQQYCSFNNYLPSVSNLTLLGVILLAAVLLDTRVIIVIDSLCVKGFSH